MDGRWYKLESGFDADKSVPFVNLVLMQGDKPIRTSQRFEAGDNDGPAELSERALQWIKDNPHDRTFDQPKK